MAWDSMFSKSISNSWWSAQAQFYLWRKNNQAALRCLRKRLNGSIDDTCKLPLLQFLFTAAKSEAVSNIELQTELEHLRGAATDSARDSETYYRAAIVLAELREFGLAVKAYERALQLCPNWSDVYCDLGLAYGELGNHFKEQQCYLNAIGIDPEHGKAWRNLAVSYADAADYEAAIPCWRRAVTLQSEDPSVWVSLGWALSKLGRFEDAVKAYEEAIKRKPDFAIAYYNIALFDLKLHNSDAAIRAAQKALELDRDYIDALTVMGMAQAQLGNHELAIHTYDSAIRKAPSSLEPYINKAESLCKLHKLKDSRAVLEKALGLCPRSPEAIYAIGEIYSQIGEHALAADLCERLRSMGSSLATKLDSMVRVSGIDGG